MVNVMNNQGCCPSFQAICAPETCPTPKPCPMYYEQSIIDNHSCCPQFKCGKRIYCILDIILILIRNIIINNFLNSIKCFFCN